MCSVKRSVTQQYEQKPRFFHFVISLFFIPSFSLSLSLPFLPLSSSFSLSFIFKFLLLLFFFFFFSTFENTFQSFFSFFLKPFFILFYFYLSFFSFHLFRFITVVQYSSRNSLGSPLVSRWLPVTPSLKHCSGILATRALKDGQKNKSQRMQRIRFIQEIQRKKYGSNFCNCIRRMLYYYIRKVQQLNVKIQVQMGFLSIDYLLKLKITRLNICLQRLLHEMWR